MLNFLITRTQKKLFSFSFRFRKLYRNSIRSQKSLISIQEDSTNQVDNNLIDLDSFVAEETDDNNITQPESARVSVETNLEVIIEPNCSLSRNTQAENEIKISDRIGTGISCSPSPDPLKVSQETRNWGMPRGSRSVTPELEHQDKTAQCMKGVSQPATSRGTSGTSGDALLCQEQSTSNLEYDCAVQLVAPGVPNSLTKEEPLSAFSNTEFRHHQGYDNFKGNSNSTAICANRVENPISYQICEEGTNLREPWRTPAVSEHTYTLSTGTTSSLPSMPEKNAHELDKNCNSVEDIWKDVPPFMGFHSQCF